jgi:uncharacterized protein (TIGR02444 family)
MNAWDFAEAHWRRPGVMACCLELQEVHGQCVALLLWRLWTLAEAREPNPETLATAVAAAREWEAAVARPLRAVRERLQSAPLGLVADTGRLALRDQILAAELAAEHTLLDALDGLAPLAAHPSTAAPDLLPALIDLAMAWRWPAPTALLTRLALSL